MLPPHANPDQSYENGVAAVTATAALAAAFILHKVTARFKFPQVLAFLMTGLAIRQLARHPVLVNSLTRWVTDAALAAMGVQIGSHLNAETLGPIKWSMARFTICFVPCVMAVVSIAAALLFPALSVYAPLVGAIAVERSSPEALAGIVEARARGPFTTAIMCISAIQDVAALVCFVAVSAVLGSSNALESLARVFAVTGAVIACAYGAVVLAQKVIPVVVPAPPRGVSAHEFRPALSAIPPSTVAVAAATIVGLTAAHHAFDSELLITAVLLGILINYDTQHPVTKVLDSMQLPINLVLFTFLGIRINVVSYAREFLPILVLAVARASGLWAGTVVGSLAAGFNSHLHTRWMGLVTQLAIALSLVTRMEEAFPAATALAQAYGGVAIASLLTGPGLLQAALHRSGESGVAASGHGGGGTTSVPRVVADEADSAVGGSSVLVRERKEEKAQARKADID